MMRDSAEDDATRLDKRREEMDGGGAGGTLGFGDQSIRHAITAC